MRMFNLDTGEFYDCVECEWDTDNLYEPGWHVGRVGEKGNHGVVLATGTRQMNRQYVVLWDSGYVNWYHGHELFLTYCDCQPED